MPDQGYFQVKASLPEGCQFHRCPQISADTDVVAGTHLGEIPITIS